MKVIRAKSAGFCWGVERAIDIAREYAQKGRHPVYTDGPLIHNRQMMEVLTGEGIGYEEDFRRVGDGGNLGGLAHHLFVNRGAAGGIEEEDVQAADLGSLKRAPGDVGRGAHFAHLVDPNDVGAAENACGDGRGGGES